MKGLLPCDALSKDEGRFYSPSFLPSSFLISFPLLFITIPLRAGNGESDGTERDESPLAFSVPEKTGKGQRISYLTVCCNAAERGKDREKKRERDEESFKGLTASQFPAPVPMVENYSNIFKSFRQCPEHQLHSNSDKGDGSVRYILSGDGAGTIFIINEVTGDIHATKSLDREKKSHYVLHAQAIDLNTNKPLEPESEFIIKVQDINDNAPKFPDGPFVTSVPEMSEVGLVTSAGGAGRTPGLSPSCRLGWSPTHLWENASHRFGGQ
ncbi:hypothetical protein P4O66_001482 [Electrophorus voltai]|uniref:Cadherin domain-containing protein n=1 Tax=Electrophorus voltai TaxID=2609070 RepID=A0AAD8Z990_9TELE|nr:hypothetical protein P4O66_001482 [Electrophorus voltai]